MSDIISLSSRKEKIEPVNEIVFDPIPISESSEKNIWIHKLISDEVFIDSLEITNIRGGGTMNIKSAPEKISERVAEPILIEAKSIDSKALQGISSEIEIKAHALLSPP